MYIYTPRKPPLQLDETRRVRGELDVQLLIPHVLVVEAALAGLKTTAVMRVNLPGTFVRTNGRLLSARHVEYDSYSRTTGE